MKSLILGVVLLSILNSCETETNQIVGGWAIDEIQAPFQILSNGLLIEDDGTCTLPMSEVSERHTTKEYGLWEVVNRNGKKYLAIDTENERFKGEFEIGEFKRYRDPESFGILVSVSLTSESVKLMCTKAEY